MIDFNFNIITGNPELLMYSLLVCGLLVAFYFIARSSISIMPFLYLNARLSSREKTALNMNRIKSITDSRSLKEFMQSISETKYLVSYTGPKDTPSITDIHSEINMVYLHELNEIINLAPRKIKPALNSIKMLEEARILKNIYRKKTSKKDIVSEEIPVFGIFTKKINDKLVGATVSDLKVILAYTPYLNILEKEYQNINEFESELDIFVLNNLNIKSKIKTYDQKIISELFEVYTANQIINLLIRSIIRGDDVEHRLFLLSKIQNNNQSNKHIETLILMAECQDIEELVERSKNSRYYIALRSAIESHRSLGGLYHFKIELQRLLNKFIEDNKIIHYQGPFQIFSYLFRKDLERTNLLAISKGIDSKLSRENLLRMVA